MRFGVVGDECREVGALLSAQAFTRPAPAQGTVEREVVGGQFLETSTACLASRVQAERFDLPVGLVPIEILGGDSHFSSTQPQGHLDAVGHAGPRGFSRRDAVDDHLDGVTSSAVDLGDVFDPEGCPVDSDTSESVLL